MRVGTAHRPHGRRLAYPDSFHDQDPIVSTSSTTSTWRRLGRLFLLVAAVGAVIFIALTLVLSRFLDPEALAARVEPRLETALARDVEVGRVEVGLFPLGVRLRDVSVADPTGLAPVLAQVESVDFRVALLPLFRREVRVARLVLENPLADLRVDADGRSNFGDLSSQPATEPEGAGGEVATEGFALDLKGIRVSGGTLRFQDLADSTVVGVENLRVRAAVQRDASGPWVFVGGSEADLTLHQGNTPSALERLPLSLSFDLEASPSFDAMEIRSGRVGADPLSLSMSGTIGGFKDPVRSLSLHLEGEGLPLDRMVTVLADRFQIELPGEPTGTLSADLQVEGSVGPGETPEVSGVVTVAGGGFEARDGTLVAQDLSAELSLVDTRRVRFEIAGEVLDGPFSIDGDGDLGGDGTLGFELRANPDLALVQSVIVLPEGVSAEGRVDARARITGSPKDLRSLRVWGEASPSNVRLTHPALAVPVILPRGRVSLEGNGASLADLPVSLGDDDLVVSGELLDLASFGLPHRTVGFRGAVRGPRLDLTKISTNPLPDPELTYGKVAFARLGGRTVAGRSPEEAAEELRLARPDSIPVAGELQVSLDTLIYTKGRVEDVRARVEFGPTVVRITEASMRRFGGDIWTSMDLALGSQAQEPFNLSLRVRGLDAGEFLSTTSPFGRAVRGQLSMDLDLVGSLDGLLLPDRPSLVGSGRFSLTGGGLNSVPLTQALSAFMGITSIREPRIEDWATSFILEDGRIRLADGRLAGTPGEPVVGGSIGFGGELDLLSVFEIDADNLEAYALDNLGIRDALAGRMEGRPGMVQAVIRIGGTILSPELHGDPAAMTQAVTETVKKEAEAEAQRQIQEQRTRLQNRATGFLRSLLQPRDTTEGVVPDTVGGDTLRPDTVPPDTVRPDTIRPDTLRPDTIRPDTLRPDTARNGRIPPPDPESLPSPAGPQGRVDVHGGIPPSGEGHPPLPRTLS
jgi:AsmA protein